MSPSLQLTQAICEVLVSVLVSYGRRYVDGHTCVEPGNRENHYITTNSCLHTHTHTHTHKQTHREHTQRERDTHTERERERERERDTRTHTETHTHIHTKTNKKEKNTHTSIRTTRLIILPLAAHAPGGKTSQLPAVQNSHIWLF